MFSTLFATYYYAAIAAALATSALIHKKYHFDSTSFIMTNKPITPLIHGIIDYAFALALLSAPSVIKLNQKAKRLHMLNALGVILYSAFTKYPVSIKQIIPLSLHKKADYSSVTLIVFETLLYKQIRKDKRAVIFNVSVTAAGMITVLLTD